MKNLKKLSRNKLKSVIAGKIYPRNLAGEACMDMCNITANNGDLCAQYGLTCGFFICGNLMVNRCL